jgi:Putative adhesin
MTGATMTTDVGYGLVRRRAFECDGPVEIDVQLGSGTIDVRLGASHTGDDASAGGGSSDDIVDAEVVDVDGSVGATDAPAEDATTSADATTDADATSDADGTASTGSAASADAGTGFTGTASDHPASGAARVEVEVRYEPREGGDFGLAGLLNWVSGQFGGSRQFAEQAVEETEIDVRGNRLIVHGPKHSPLRGVPLTIVVSAPAGSSVRARGGSADVRVTGTSGGAQLDTGSGDISLERAEGAVLVKSGSGSVRLGPAPQGLSARTGSGDVEVASVTGDGTLHTGSGDIWLGSLRGDVNIRTGSGDLTVADAVEGRLDLTTGSGDLRVGIHSGTVAELDVMSGSGRTRSDLPVSDGPPPAADAPRLRLRARTGSGEVVIGPATA